MQMLKHVSKLIVALFVLDLSDVAGAASLGVWSAESSSGNQNRNNQNNQQQPPNQQNYKDIPPRQ